MHRQGQGVRMWAHRRSQRRIQHVERRKSDIYDGNLCSICAQLYCHTTAVLIPWLLELAMLMSMAWLATSHTLRMSWPMSRNKMIVWTRASTSGEPTMPPSETSTTWWTDTAMGVSGLREGGDNSRNQTTRLRLSPRSSLHWRSVDSRSKY